MADELPAPTDASTRVATPAAGAAAVRGSVLQSAAYVIVFGLSLISAPLLIRHLGLVAFGRYSTVVAVVTIVGGLTDAGMINIALREWSSRQGRDREATMRLLLGLRVQLGVLGLAAGTGYALLAGFDATMVIGTVLAGLGLLLQLIADVLAIALQGELRFGWPAIIMVSRQVVSVSLIVALVLAGAGLLPFFAVTIPAGIVTLILTGWVVRAHIPLRPTFRGAGGWTLLRDTLPYAAAIAINTIYFRVSILVMHQIGTPLQTGYFATSFRVTEVLIGVPALAIGAAFPILTHSARSNAERFASAVGRILELAFIVAVPVVLGLVLGAPFIVDVLVHRGGGPVVGVLRIQAFALIATFVATACAYPLLSLRRYRAMLIGNCAGLAANVALSLILIPSHQAHGAAISAVVAESCVAVGQLGFLLRVQRVSTRLRIVLASLAAGAAGAATLFIPGIPSLARTGLGLVVYVVALTLLGALPPEVTHLLKVRHPR